jgi:uncharacterized protein DUF2283
MAHIPLAELLAFVKTSPNYYKAWSGDVPAEQSLYIEFGRHNPPSKKTETMEVRNGLLLVLDFDDDGKVQGLEIH